MAKIVLLPVLLSFLLQPFASVALTQDFCVADMTSSDTPAGYPCKAPPSVTSEDFTFQGLAAAGNTSNVFNTAITFAFVDQFPGINGLGLSGARLDFAVGGVIPLHTHPLASELIFVIQGTLNAGFISASSNTAYTKTLNAGDIMVFPQGLLHYQINIGKGPALAFVALGSSNPGIQVISSGLFGNNLPSAVVEKVTLLDDAEVMKLKALFGGSG